MKSARLVLLCVSLWLGGCVSLTSETSLHVWPGRDNVSVLMVYVKRPGFYTNIHGGNTDSYHIDISRGSTDIASEQIALVFGEKRLRLSEQSRIVFAADGKCEVTLALYAPNGKPLLFSGLNINGTHVFEADDCRGQRP